jgi:hypothetical protein
MKRQHKQQIDKLQRQLTDEIDLDAEPQRGPAKSSDSSPVRDPER